MAQAYQDTALQFLANRPMTPFSSVALRVVVLIVTWEQRKRTRHHLSELDTHLLKDIGITPDQARTEAQKPFWRL